VSEITSVEVLAEELQALFLLRAKELIANPGATPDALKIAMAIYKEFKPRGSKARPNTGDAGELPFGG
jgi:hypothetical protein